jgi:hypothetical protein
VATGVISRGYSIGGVKVATQLHLVSRLRISAAIPPFPYTSSWHEQGKLYLLHHCPSKNYNCLYNFIRYGLVDLTLRLLSYVYI